MRVTIRADAQHHPGRTGVISRPARDGWFVLLDPMDGKGGAPVCVAWVGNGDIEGGK